MTVVTPDKPVGVALEGLPVADAAAGCAAGLSIGPKVIAIVHKKPPTRSTQAIKRMRTTRLDIAVMSHQRPCQPEFLVNHRIVVIGPARQRSLALIHHSCSNIETTFHMIKSKFGQRLRSRT